MYYITFAPFLSLGKGFPSGMRNQKGAWYVLGERDSQTQENVKNASIYWYYLDVIETSYHKKRTIHIASEQTMHEEAPPLIVTG